MGPGGITCKKYGGPRIRELADKGVGFRNALASNVRTHRQGVGNLAETGLDPHTTNLSLGVNGRTNLLTPPDIRQYTGMCEHGMASPVLIRDAIRKAKTSKARAWEMSIALAKPRTCGIFNPHRPEELLKEMTLYLYGESMVKPMDGT